jgi:hypothetical protein
MSTTAVLNRFWIPMAVSLQKGKRPQLYHTAVSEVKREREWEEGRGRGEKKGRKGRGREGGREGGGREGEGGVGTSCPRALFCDDRL